MKIEPLADRVIIKRAEEASVTPGGIIVPDNAKQKSLEGYVVAVGDGRILEDGRVVKLEVKEGDRVLFAGKYTGTEVQIDGVDHLIMSEEEILGVYENE